MRILYINKAVSGPMESLARFIAQGRGGTSVFMAERWPREMRLPGCMFIKLPPVTMHEGSGRTAHRLEQAVENIILRSMRNSANVKENCRRLRQGGFVPDIIYASSQDGYAMEVQDEFPDARMVARLDGLYPLRSHAQGGEDDDALIRLSACERMCNAFQVALLTECAAGITASNWQKTQMNKLVGDKVRVIGSGIDVQFFSPPANPSIKEIITFSCQGTSSARGIHTICQSLPQVLTLRPECKVNIVSFAARRSDAGRMHHVRELAAVLPPLPPEQLQRVSIVASPPPALYLSLLQRTTLYVYLTAPSQLSAGILEAMGCGVLVLASDTDAVREVVTPGENGLLWKGNDAQSLAFEVAQACAQVSDTSDLRRSARETILAQHDVRKLLPQHAAAVLGA